jgi:hypothetical protein
MRTIYVTKFNLFTVLTLQPLIVLTLQPLIVLTLCVGTHILNAPRSFNQPIAAERR